MSPCLKGKEKDSLTVMIRTVIKMSARWMMKLGKWSYKDAMAVSIKSVLDVWSERR